MNPAGTCRVAIRTKRSAAEFTALAGERVLFAGLRNGFNLPYDCASGSCGTCQAELTSPETGAIENAFLTAPASESLASGRVLMCQSICRGDVQLKVFSTIAPLPEHEPRPDHFDGSIDSIVELAPNTFAVSLRTSSRIAYLPGQFVLISADSVRGYRAYSMTSREQRNGALEFVIRTTPSGAFSKWLRETAHAASKVRVFGPLGRAVLRSGDERNLIAIAGGTGIAGIMAIIESALASGHVGRHRAMVIFGVRTRAEAFFLDRLSNWVERAGGHLEVVVALVDGPDDAETRNPYPNLTFRRGLVLDVARNALEGRKELLDASCFLGGPPAVVDLGTRLLCGTLGISPQQVKFDRFY